MDPIAEFYKEKRTALARYSQDAKQKELIEELTKWCFDNRYMYHFEALGRPIIQFPPDIIAVQELVWTVRPDLIIETGIAHGGSVVNSAHMLATLDMADAMSAGVPFDWRESKRRVLALDIDIRSHNRERIDVHPFRPYIEMIEGSSIDKDIIEKVRDIASKSACVMVLLDSNHTHDHVLAELNAYGSLVTPGSYCIVFDTVIEEMPMDYFQDRPWNPGNSPLSAVGAFLAQPGTGKEFRPAAEYNDKLVLSGCRGGYLRRRVQGE